MCVCFFFGPETNDDRDVCTIGSLPLLPGVGVSRRELAMLCGCRLLWFMRLSGVKGARELLGYLVCRSEGGGLAQHGYSFCFFSFHPTTHDE